MSDGFEAPYKPTEPRGEPGLKPLEFCSYDKDCIYVRNGDVEHCPGHSPHYDPGKPKAAPEPLDLDALKEGA